MLNWRKAAFVTLLAMIGGCSKVDQPKRTLDPKLAEISRILTDADSIVAFDITWQQRGYHNRGSFTHGLPDSVPLVGRLANRAKPGDPAPEFGYVPQSRGRRLSKQAVARLRTILVDPKAHEQRS